MSGLMVAALAIGGGIWYSSTVGSYERISGITAVPVSGEMRAVSNYQGLDGDSSPLKLRGCFDADWAFQGATENNAIATALVTPGWFDCFDDEALNADIDAGIASVLISEENIPFGFTTYIAHYADGRGYLWREINACGTAQFAGDPLPLDCPGAERPEGTIAAATVTGGTEVISVVDGSVRGTGTSACFQTPMSIALITETFVILDEAIATPTNAPACFPTTLAEDASSGQALALKGADTNQIIAIYPDGRGLVWVTE
ncbi:MAG: DUF6446 family protein [Pseudomonadota bacterium]